MDDLQLFACIVTLILYVCSLFAVQAKDLAHIWELGGGTWLSKLVDIPLQPESLQ
jgi:hypothetical protein